MRHRPPSQATLSFLLICTITTPACAATGEIPPPAGIPGIRVAEPWRPVEVVTIAEPLPLPGQLKPIPRPMVMDGAADPRTRVGAANMAARIQPVRDGFINAMQVYPWMEGALFQIYAAPGQVTDIALQPGETLVGAGPVAAGDTVRWIIGDTVSGTGDGQRVHILAKPTRSDLATNLVINTDRRTYHLELRATPATYMASVSWSYPKDQLIALGQRNAALIAKAPIATDVSLASLNFGYAITGDKPSWRPVRAFDDGRQVFIEFPPGIGQDEMPPIFIIGAGNAAELVNYRVQNRFIVMDRLFGSAELRMGDKRSEQRVRIERAVSGKGARR